MQKCSIMITKATLINILHSTRKQGFAGLPIVRATSASQSVTNYNMHEKLEGAAMFAPQVEAHRQSDRLMDSEQNIQNNGV